MKRIGFCLGLVLMICIQQDAFSDFDHHPRHRASVIDQKIYLAQGRNYGEYSRKGHYFTSEKYYSCPRGDFISDRPGRCPLDGSVLVPRSVNYDHGEPYYQERY